MSDGWKFEVEKLEKFKICCYIGGNLRLNGWKF